MGTGSRHQHVVDRAWQVGEEARQPLGVTEIERRDARTELEADCVQPVRSASREDQVRSLVPSAARRLQPDSGAAAEHEDGLARELLLAAITPVHAVPGQGPIVGPVRAGAS